MKTDSRKPYGKRRAPERIYLDVATTLKVLQQEFSSERKRAHSNDLARLIKQRAAALNYASDHRIEPAISLS